MLETVQAAVHAAYASSTQVRPGSMHHTRGSCSLCRMHPGMTFEAGPAPARLLLLRAAVDASALLGSFVGLLLDSSPMRAACAGRAMLLWSVVQQQLPHA